MDGLLVAILIAGSVTDVRSGKVYNSLTYSAVAAGLLLNAFLRPGGLGLEASLYGLLTGFVPMFVIYVAGGLGGGDVKLMAATGAFLGPRATLYALLYTCIVGGVLALGILLWREGFAGIYLRIRDWRKSRLAEDGHTAHRFPFAVAVLAGAVWSIVEARSGRSLLELLRS